MRGGAGASRRRPRENRSRQLPHDVGASRKRQYEARRRCQNKPGVGERKQLARHRETETGRIRRVGGKFYWQDLRLRRKEKQAAPV